MVHDLDTRIPRPASIAAVDSLAWQGPWRLGISA